MLDGEQSICFVLLGRNGDADILVVFPVLAVGLCHEFPPLLRVIFSGIIRSRNAAVNRLSVKTYTRVYVRETDV